MEQQTVCIIIRVYDRVADLELNLEIIKKTWLLNKYYIIISANGVKDGFALPDKVIKLSSKINIIGDNIGHLKGNSQLLLTALPYIPSSCKYTIILEADTWVFSDDLIEKYISLLDASEAVWASAKWYDKCFSLATDFAIIKTEFLYSYSDVFKFSKLPECYVANFLDKNNKKYLYIKENMPVLLPAYIKKYPYSFCGRFFVFPKSKTVTHHVEFLSGGIEEKKFFFNVVSRVHVFDHLYAKKKTSREFLKIKIAHLFSYIFPRKSWFKKNIRLYD
jgi:hypothetical protein